MCHVAAEMEREGFTVPLLIGGATTSRVHTAVKINPNYERGQTIYVTDASRAVGVVSSLMSETERGPYIDNVRAEYVKIREAYVQGRAQEDAHDAGGRARQPLQDRLVGLHAAAARFLGTRAVQGLRAGRAGALHRLDAVLPDLGAGGNIRASSTTTWSAPEAKKLFADAQAMLKRMVAENWLTANAVFGFWPANAVGDDIVLYDDETRATPLGDAAHAAPADGAREPRATAPTPRSPISSRPKETGLADYVGAFAVTAGIGEAEALARHIDKTDDYGASC